jgi:transcriptional regulator with XRE-family HTH domain
MSRAVPAAARAAVEDGRTGLGERLRRARADKGMGLRELARRLDVSPSLVSQIETGKIEPSVKTLYAMVTELGVSFDEMFSSVEVVDAPAPQQDVSPPVEHPPADRRGLADDERRGAARVQKAGSGRALELQTGVRWERLFASPELELEVRHTTYPPGSSSSDDGTFVRHAGREFGVVTHGTLSITVGFDDYVLGPGDSISFDSTIPHRFRNEGHEPVHTIWIEIDRYGGAE